MVGTVLVRALFIPIDPWGLVAYIFGIVALLSSLFAVAVFVEWYTENDIE